MPTLTRRRVLTAAAGAALASTVPVAARAATPLPDNPFTLGVASGDPETDSVILWTRLALRPEDPSGRGGMPVVAHDLEWEIAADEHFSAVVNRGTAVAQPTFAHAVHVEAGGLQPGREYHYRFRTGAWVSPVGRTRTLPGRGETPAVLRIAHTSCAMWSEGYFNGYRELAADEPDLVLFLGDYTYEYDIGLTRAPTLPPTLKQRTIADYRCRYAQYHSDPDLQRAHQAAPWLVVPDDHEFENNWAGAGSQTRDQQRRRAVAFRAYYENMPLRRSSLPAGLQMQLFRRVHWGRLATFHMLDTRQYRDDQACTGSFGDCAAADDPGRTILGARQRRWLEEGFAGSRAAWDVLGNQVWFSQFSVTPGARVVNLDAWDGYRADRRHVIDSFQRSGARHLLVLTGDIHSHWATDVLARDEPDAPVVGSELISSSISAFGDGLDVPLGAVGAWNPQIKFGTFLRGYVNSRITPGSVSADFRCLPRVSDRRAKAFTRATFVVAGGEPGLQRVRSDESVARRQGAERVERPTSQQVREWFRGPGR